MMLRLNQTLRTCGSSTAQASQNQVRFIKQHSSSPLRARMQCVQALMRSSEWLRFSTAIPIFQLRILGLWFVPENWLCQENRVRRILNFVIRQKQNKNTNKQQNTTTKTDDNHKTKPKTKTKPKQNQHTTKTTQPTQKPNQNQHKTNQNQNPKEPKTNQATKTQPNHKPNKQNQNPKTQTSRNTQTR